MRTREINGQRMEPKETDKRSNEYIGNRKSSRYNVSRMNEKRNQDILITNHEHITVTTQFTLDSEGQCLRKYTLSRRNR